MDVDLDNLPVFDDQIQRLLAHVVVSEAGFELTIGEADCQARGFAALTPQPRPRRELPSSRRAADIRNAASPHWRRWLGPESRCVVPFTSFSENELQPDGSRPPVWFALDETRPLAFFAGLWTRWASVRKVREGETTNDLFGFLTATPNAEVEPIHPKAVPVILTTAGEIDTWLDALAKVALELQRPLPDGAPRIGARGDRKDSEAA